VLEKGGGGGHMNQPCNTCEHTHMNESFHTYSRVVSYEGVALHMKKSYAVATVSRIDKITGLFCRISSLL